MTWNLLDGGQQSFGGHVIATSLLTAVGASITPHAVGAWVQMVAAAPFSVSEILVTLGKAGIAVAAQNSQTMLDIGIGTAPETAIIQDVAIGGSLAFTTWRFPVMLPAGTRIVARLRSAVASKSVTMGMSIVGGGNGWPTGAKATTYGQVTTGSRGTILTAPTGANAKAAWTVITAATTAPARWMVVGISAPNNALATAADGLLDIGVGSAPESPIINNIPFGVSANEEVNHPKPLTFPVNIPDGARVVARYQATSILPAATPTITLTGIH